MSSEPPGADKEDRALSSAESGKVLQNPQPPRNNEHSTGRTAPNQLDSSGLPEMRSHFHHQRVGLNRQRGSDKIARMKLILL